MEKIIHVKVSEVEPQHRTGHGSYEYFVRRLNPYRHGGASVAGLYEIPPGKSNCPYHYHIDNEESFYILSGTGLLKTPDGDRHVEAGDFIYFPAGEQGAHKLTNTSETEPLIYLDFDTSGKANVCVYPDSKKVNVSSPDFSTIHRLQDAVGYYDGE